MDRLSQGSAEWRWRFALTPALSPGERGDFSGVATRPTDAAAPKHFGKHVGAGNEGRRTDGSRRASAPEAGWDRSSLSPREGAGVRANRDGRSPTGVAARYSKLIAKI